MFNDKPKQKTKRKTTTRAIKLISITEIGFIHTLVPLMHAVALLDAYLNRIRILKTSFNCGFRFNANAAIDFIDFAKCGKSFCEQLKPNKLFSKD